MKNWMGGLVVVCSLIACVFLGCDGAHYEQGELLYNKFCGNCHGDDGTGLQQLIPPLAGADFLHLRRDELPCIIKYGLSDTIVVNGVQYSQNMPGVPKLSEFEIQNIINYINNAWGHEYGFTKYREVQQALKTCQNSSKQ